MNSTRLSVPRDEVSGWAIIEARRLYNPTLSTEAHNASIDECKKRFGVAQWQSAIEIVRRELNGTTDD